VGGCSCIWRLKAEWDGTLPPLQPDASKRACPWLAGHYTTLPCSRTLLRRRPRPSCGPGMATYQSQVRPQFVHVVSSLLRGSCFEGCWAAACSSQASSSQACCSLHGTTPLSPCARLTPLLALLHYLLCPCTRRMRGRDCSAVRQGGAGGGAAGGLPHPPAGGGGGGGRQGWVE